MLLITRKDIKCILLNKLVTLFRSFAENKVSVFSTVESLLMALRFAGTILGSGYNGRHLS